MGTTSAEFIVGLPQGTTKRKCKKYFQTQLTALQREAESQLGDSEIVETKVTCTSLARRRRRRDTGNSAQVTMNSLQFQVTFDITTKVVVPITTSAPTTTTDEATIVKTTTTTTTIDPLAGITELLTLVVMVVEETAKEEQIEITFEKESIHVAQPQETEIVEDVAVSFKQAPATTAAPTTTTTTTITMTTTTTTSKTTTTTTSATTTR